jgi:hypothetical protein
MRASIGTRFQTETGSFSAVAHCAQHATLYGNPVIFERFCHYAGGWTCEEATEMVLARYPDRQVNISAKDVSLTDAYWIVSYFVLRKDIERATIDDPLRWLKRLRSDGTTRYQQVPLPECATTDNPACVYGPALSVNEFREGKSGGE